MKKPRKRSESRKYPDEFTITEAEMVERIKRPLGWMNRLLDALIQILESHLRHGAEVSPGTRNLIELIESYKKRAILEGFYGYFPESDYLFAAWFRYLEHINNELNKAKLLRNDRRACQGALGRAGFYKKMMPNLFLPYMGIDFSTWYALYYDVDKILERLLDSIENDTLTDKELLNRLLDLRIAVKTLKELTAGDDYWEAAGDVDDEIRVDFDHMLDRLDFLIIQVRSGDWKASNAADRARIRTILRQVRTIKHRSIRRLGEFGGKSLLEWYLRLFEMDYLIENAIDHWEDGRMLPEWDPEWVRIMIRKIERAKIRFLRLFPPFLDMSMVFWYNEFYLMDLHLDEALKMLDAKQIRQAIRELRHVRTHKHRIERVLNDS